jgi:hypothetical protein
MMTPISRATQRELLQERYAIEDRARQLIRRILEELGGSAELRDELRFLNAKGEVFFGGIDDLILADPSDLSPGEEGNRRAFRRDTDALFLARAELDRKVLDARRRAVEVEEDVRVERATRFADELKIEIARLDGPQTT